MKVTCKTHGTDIRHGRCEHCCSENLAKYQEAFKGMRVTFSVPARETTVLVDGVESIWSHDRGWIDLSVPEEHRQAIEEYIEKLTSNYEATCNCAVCQMKRAERTIKEKNNEA